MTSGLCWVQRNLSNNFFLSFINIVECYFERRMASCWWRMDKTRRLLEWYTASCWSQYKSRGCSDGCWSYSLHLEINQISLCFLYIYFASFHNNGNAKQRNEPLWTITSHNDPKWTRINHYIINSPPLFWFILGHYGSFFCLTLPYIIINQMYLLKKKLLLKLIIDK